MSDCDSRGRTVRLPNPYFAHASEPHTSEPHTFGFKLSYLLSFLYGEQETFKVLRHFTNIGSARAQLRSRAGSVGPMRGGHTVPALSGLASSAVICPRLQVSLCASLPALVAERPVAGRPVARAIWVRRVTAFFCGDFCLPCVGVLEISDQLPAVYLHLCRRVLLWHLRSPA